MAPLLCRRCGQGFLADDKLIPDSLGRYYHIQCPPAPAPDPAPLVMLFLEREHELRCAIYQLRSLVLDARSEALTGHGLTPDWMHRSAITLGNLPQE